MPRQVGDEAAADRAARVGDADRQRAVTLLTSATAAGYLRLDEFDVRVGDVWAAATQEQLLAAQRDVPEQVRRAHAEAEAAAVARDGARTTLRGHLVSYAVVMLVLVLAWLVTGLSSGAWYPWPVWPALGWGIGLVGHVRAAAGRGRAR